MILRPSQKLNARIKGGTLAVLPRHENPLLDWSAHVFAVGRAEYVLVSNTTSLYSAVLADAGLRDAARFTERVLGVVRAVLDGAGRLPDERLAPVEPVRFAKSLGRSVTGSMNELITHATALLADGDLPVADVGVRLNDILCRHWRSGPTSTAGHARRSRNWLPVRVRDARRCTRPCHTRSAVAPGRPSSRRKATSRFGHSASAPS